MKQNHVSFGHCTINASVIESNSLTISPKGDGLYTCIKGDGSSF